MQDLAWALHSFETSPSILHLLHTKFWIGYQPKAKERRILLGSWLLCVGTHSKKSPAIRLNPLEKIRQLYPNQTAQNTMLESSVFLRFPHKKTIFLLLDNLIFGYQEPRSQTKHTQLYRNYQRASIPSGWKIHHLFEHEIYDTTTCRKKINHALE